MCSGATGGRERDVREHGGHDVGQRADRLAPAGPGQSVRGPELDQSGHRGGCVSVEGGDRCDGDVRIPHPCTGSPRGNPLLALVGARAGRNLRGQPPPEALTTSITVVPCAADAGMDAAAHSDGAYGDGGEGDGSLRTGGCGCRTVPSRSNWRGAALLAFGCMLSRRRRRAGRHQNLN